MPLGHSRVPPSSLKYNCLPPSLFKGKVKYKTFSDSFDLHAALSKNAEDPGVVSQENGQLISD